MRIHPPEEEQEFRFRQKQEEAQAATETNVPDNLVVGRKPVLEALEGATGVEKIFLQFGTHGSAIDSIYRLAKQRGVPIQQTTRERLASMSGDQETQGVVAIVAAVAYLELEELLAKVPEGTSGCLLILDEIEDPHNVGALLRSALCFGLHGAILPRHHSAPVNATVVKTSAGAALSLPMARVSNIVNAIDELKQKGIKVVGLEGSADATIAAADLSGPMALVVGNEGRGVRRLVKEHCDLLVKIPMSGLFDSLNASVAGAIAMYEVSKNRSSAGGPPKPS